MNDPNDLPAPAYGAPPAPSFDLYLIAPGPDRVLALLGIREAMGCGLSEAVEVLRGTLPAKFIADATQRECKSYARDLELRGWTTETRPHTP